MAKIIIDGQEFEVKESKEGSSFIEEAESAGVPFGCQDGLCGSCRVKVLEGKEHLSPQTQEEKDMELGPDERLVCQCKIKKGTCKMKYF